MNFFNFLSESAYDKLPLEYKGMLQPYQRYIVNVEQFKDYMMITMKVSEIGIDVLTKLHDEFGLLSVMPSNSYRGSLVLNFPIKEN